MLEKELSIAVDAAKAGARAIRNVDSEAEDRGDRADRASHDAISRKLRSEFPEDGILSEEGPAAEEARTRKRLWVVDPLDGTREFVAGLPEYVVSVALVKSGRPVLGVVVHPPTGQTFQAIKKKGSYCDGKRLGVSLAPPLDRARGIGSRSSHEKGDLARVEEAVAEMTPMGSIAWRMALVAAGRYDFTLSVHPLSEWDICAADLILVEAGGSVELPGGKQPRYGRKDPRFPTGLLALPAEPEELSTQLRALGVS